MDGREAYKIYLSHRDINNNRHYRVRQTINGLEVIGGMAIIHVDKNTNVISSVDSQFLPGTGLSSTPAIAGSDALAM